MSECHGWRGFHVVLIFLLAGSAKAEPPTPEAKKVDAVKKRDSSTGSALSPSDRATETPQAPVVVRLLDRRESGWDVAETNHFRVYHVDQPDVAREAAVAAERARTAAYRKWFSDNSPDWDQRGEVFIYATARDYSAGSGVPPQSPGHSEIRVDGGRIIMRRIHVHADAAVMVTAILPHEVTHTVLAGQFGDKQVPRWADEGMAVLGEPQERIDRHLRTLPRQRKAGQLYTTRELIGMKDYPEPRRIAAFYAQSVSLAGFLAKSKNPRELARFIKDGERDGYEKALKNHYGWDFDELDRRWQQHAFGE
jgi:hypothetical protein